MKEVQYIKIDEQGNKFYYKDKEMTKFHRTDGPAAEYTDGAKQWWVNGKVHRTDGPAAVYDNDGNQYWYVDGKRHRIDGPAIEFYNGTKRWYIDDVNLTEEEFNYKTQPTININGKIFTINELNQLIEAAKGK